MHWSRWCFSLGQAAICGTQVEADRGRIETRTIQVAAAPAGLKYPGMEQAALIERYTTFTDKNGKAVTRSETVLILTTATPDQAPPADLLALSRGHWAATEATTLTITIWHDTITDRVRVGRAGALG